MTSCCGENQQGSVIDDVKEYYGKTLKTSDDLQTTACKTPVGGLPKHIREALSLVHDEVVMKYYGCGIVAPDCLEGMSVLDLGSGSGRDCFALSKLVGEEGNVVGIDMTDEQLEVANQYIDYHRDTFGYKKANVTFVKGYIENLKDAGIGDESVDIIISNCVINLCKDKRSVLQEAYRVLKKGGELYFSDVYCDRVLSDDIRNHKVLWNECVSGALHWKELFQLAQETGFELPRTFSAHAFEITKPDLKEVVGDARFASVTYRLFKIEKQPDTAKNFEVLYDGEITGCETKLKLDHKTTVCADKPCALDANTSAILKQSRLRDFLTFRPASCCANQSPVTIEDPFEIIASGGSPSAKPACCC